MTENLPADCPTHNGGECPVAEEHKRNHRRSTDRLPASLVRIIMALIGVIGAGSGGYLFRDRVMAAPPAAVSEMVDRQAREDLRLLKAEIGGDLKLINQQLAQILEAQKESREERERLVRRIERLPR